MGRPKTISIPAQETKFYPALVKILKHNPLFTECDLDSIELTAFVKKAPLRIRDIDTPIENLKRYAQENSHMIHYCRDEQLICKKNLVQMMKIDIGTLNRWLKAGVIQKGKSKYCDWEIYQIDSVIAQLKIQKEKQQEEKP